jgi:hypothetical protein
MISKNPGWALLALSMLLFQARAADKITKQRMESHGKKRTYYLMVPDSAKSAVEKLKKEAEELEQKAARIRSGQSR